MSAACRATDGHLTPDQSSVATRVQFDHLAPVAVGSVVLAEATLVKVEGRRLIFTNADAGHARRLVGAYGTRVENVLADVTRPDDLGPRFGADLTGAEVRYLMTKEWAQTAEDVLWRRSKLGLRVSEAERAALERFMAQ